YYVTFVNDLATADVPALTMNAPTGGTAINVEILKGVGNEVQTLTFGASATGGSVTASVYGVAPNAVSVGTGVPKKLQTKLEALSTVGSGNVKVIGAEDSTSTSAYTVIFKSSLGLINLPQMTTSNAGILPATGTFTPATVAQGQSSEVQTITYTG